MWFGSLVLRMMRKILKVRDFILSHIAKILDSRQPQIQRYSNIRVHRGEPQPLDSSDQRFNLKGEER